jgi:sugar phosphate isomerase/epimerase
MTTDFATDTGCPEPHLRRIADAGFSHVHWCHQWSTDFVYSEPEVHQIAHWLREFGLGVTDVHASSGREKAWGSEREYERLAGVELVKNRIDMAAALGSDVIIMHLPAEPEEAPAREAYWSRMSRSLDALEPHAIVRGVRIALENLSPQRSFDTIQQALSHYGPEYLGLCYDAGHGHLSGQGPERLERLSDRLISMHLHDNDGSGDQHKLLFSGSVDWAALARIIARSSYGKWISMETTLGNTGITDEADFLRQAFETGTRFAEMVEEAR